MTRILAGVAAMVLMLAHPGSSRASDVQVQVVVLRDIVYRTVDGKDLHLDVYRPASPEALPAVILIHEGAWRWGSKAAWEASAPELAEEGFVVLAINHRLAPNGGTWHAPAQMEDVRAATAWVRENADSLAVDVTRVGALGSSSGAHLAMLSATANPGPDETLQAVVSWSGPTLLTAKLGGARVRSLVRNYVGCGRLICYDKWLEESPVFHVDEGDPPMLLAHGWFEFLPLAQADRMVEALRESNVPAEVVAPTSDAHGMALMPLVWDESVNFLKAHLGT